MTDFSSLDNPIWHALTTAQAVFAEGDGLAKRYPPSVSPLAGLRAPSAEAYRALASLLHPAGVAALFLESQPTPPDGWQVLEKLQLAQMICESGEKARNEHPSRELGKDDLQEMISLAELTKPGPFNVRTPELGAYLGIHSNGKLVAMAGERLRLRGFTEVSAVCTHPEHRGAGYASSLVSTLVLKIIGRHELPFLHVRSDNTGAIHVYEKLGFRIRRLLELVVLKRVATASG